VICVVVVQPDGEPARTAAGLVERCEEYLRSRGARAIYGGGMSPWNPFYVGLYGGGDLPGILDSDTSAREAFASGGYRETGRNLLFQRELSGFETQIDRRQMQLRRQVIVEVTADAPTRTFWEASTLGEFELTRFDVVPRSGGRPIASATFRSLEPSGAMAVCRSAGLLNLFVDESYRRRGLACFLMSEAFRQFLRQGITKVDSQAREVDSAIIGVFQKLCLQESGRASVWRKDV
jgi:GNAT superfamily N-acetyltransferase